MERRRRAGTCDQQVSGLKKARLCRVAPGENYACSAGFFLSLTGSVKQAPRAQYVLYNILSA
jgi:hypothetical protein